MRLSTPLWYHPSTVVMLDDEPNFIKRLVKTIPDSFTPYIQTDPNNVLDYLKSWSYKPHDLAKTLLSPGIEALPTEKNIESYELNVSKLNRKLIDGGRFKRSVVAVIDRHMDAVDGLDFCEKIREELNLPIKLILLTGATTPTEVIDSFNKGIINAYVEKRPDAGMVDQLNQHLNQLAWTQFGELSETILGSLTDQFKHLSAPEFYHSFNAIREKENIVEFYALNSCKNFLLLDSEGNAKVLSVYTDEDFELAIDFAKDTQASEGVIKALEERSAYPVTLSRHLPSSLEGDNWSQAMQAVDRAGGSGIFYHLAAEPSLNKKFAHS